MRIAMTVLALLTISIGVSQPPAAGQLLDEPTCTDVQQASGSFVDEQGIEIVGGNCIPDERVPGTAEFSYAYKPLCQPNIPDDCAPRVCDTAESPARLFAVTRTPLATGIPESMGAGCYSTKNDPPKLTPGDVFEKLKTVPIPTAAIAIQPPDGRTLVNFKTIVSSNAAPYETDVRVLGQDVHLWIRPITWTWDFGDGTDPLVRESAGLPWTEGVALSEVTSEKYTFHEYSSPSTFTIGLAVTWTADFRVGDEPPRPVPGSVDIISPGVPVEALEARPQLVR